jgi:hypothetical protein
MFEGANRFDSAMMRPARSSWCQRVWIRIIQPPGVSRVSRSGLYQSQCRARVENPRPRATGLGHLSISHWRESQRWQRRRRPRSFLRYRRSGRSDWYQRRIREREVVLESSRPGNERFSVPKPALRTVAQDSSRAAGSSGGPRRRKVETVAIRIRKPALLGRSTWHLTSKSVSKTIRS